MECTRRTYLNVLDVGFYHQPSFVSEPDTMVHFSTFGETVFNLCRTDVRQNQNRLREVLLESLMRKVLQMQHKIRQDA